MKILVSACLLGRNCKYNGGNNCCQKVLEHIRGHEVVEVCPEVAAGMGVPRDPVEIVDGVVRDRQGNSYDAQIRAAVADILGQIRDEDIDHAILKSRSPTCGVHQIYDGTFSGTRVDGSGTLAKALLEAGYRVMDEEEL